MNKTLYCLLFSLISLVSHATENDYSWSTPSHNSSESMPCGGGDIGLNVWVEKGEIFFYIARSGAFDENNTLLKQGRIRIQLTPNPFTDSTRFRQTLKLNKGYIEIVSKETKIELWTDVYKPVVHVEIDSKKAFTSKISYENWRHNDRLIRKGEGDQGSYKWAVPSQLSTHKDSIQASSHSLLFYHRNGDKTIFDVAASQQGLDGVKSEMYNPLSQLTSGGKMWGDNLIYVGTSKGVYTDTEYKSWIFSSEKATKRQTIALALEVSQTPDIEQWNRNLKQTIAAINPKSDRKRAEDWWHNFWNRSFIHLENDSANISRNYTLFRYMLGCNALSSWPTRFNGGLFTFDPTFVNKNMPFTPDYRRWTGGTFTAQNQRLIYWPMLKSGDFDAMLPQFEFYRRILKNAEIRSRVYWGHNGACFTEQLENFGLPNPSEYGWKRPDSFDKGVEYNAWLEYTWDTVLEFCQMILETKSYNNANISRYLPLIKSSLQFFDEHYRYLAQLRGRKNLDGDGKLILYPGSGCETFKMATNASSTIAALRTVIKAIGNDSLLKLIPEIPLRTLNGKTMISPAKAWERTNNTEPSQLYPIFPWRIYGVGRDSLQIARNTYLYDPYALKFRSHVGWKQDNIFAACLGLTEEAKQLNTLKLKNGPYRFPAFWGPGFDWSPDHNWGGSGMIGLQEMLLQNTDNGKILLFPAWPKKWNVHFKLRAPQNTSVEVILRNGIIEFLEVIPEQRKTDIINMLSTAN